jgi:effector-binding domain-containing protein
VNRPGDYLVSVRVAAPRAFAAVRARLPVARVPSLFTNYLNQVYAAARDGAISLDGQNIFVYRDAGVAGEADIEFGVGVRKPFEAAGPVQYSQMPVGQVATTTHWRDYALGGAHDAVIAWCREHGRTPTGTRWEVYGHWSEDPEKVRTDVYYLLEQGA